MDLATTRRSWRTSVAVAGAATLLFFGAACSSDSKSGTPSTTAAVAADPTTSGPPSTAPATTLPPTTTRTIKPVAGAAGVGDALFPGLGNGGYDVASYTIAIDARPDDPAIRATTRIDAVATIDLLSFD